MRNLLLALPVAAALLLACVGQDASAEVAAADRDSAILVPRYDAVDIAIDGKLDEPIWQEVAGYDNMVVVEPETLGPTRFRTMARFLYTDRGLYIGVWNEQPRDTLIARLSSRDEDISRDAWGITLDTSGEGLYGYWFTVNLGGSVMDGKILPERNSSREWDGPWDSATVELDDGWSAELFLPWSMMTMPHMDGDRMMGFFAARRIAYINERWGWPALPSSGARFISAFQPIKLPDVAPKRQFDLFPYASAALDNRDSDNNWNAGVDVFWRPSSNFQVTATALPDFGAVESDDAVINLTARETYFPDKRLFFVEGGEIFATSGRSAVASQRRSRGATSEFGGARPSVSTSRRPPSSVLNTRRIGGAPILAYSTEVKVESPRLAEPTDLLGAAKVVGQTGSVRYGVLAAFEDDPLIAATVTDETGATSDTSITGTGRNFGVVRFLYERSGAGRRSIGYIGTRLDHPLHRATVHGVDAQFSQADGKWRAELQTLASDVRCTPAGVGMKRSPACPEDTDGSQRGYGAWGDIYYTPRPGLRHNLRVDLFDEHLNIKDLGFLSRNDRYGAFYSPVARTHQCARLAPARHPYFRRPVSEHGGTGHPRRRLFHERLHIPQQERAAHHAALLSGALGRSREPRQRRLQSQPPQGRPSGVRHRYQQTRELERAVHRLERRSRRNGLHLRRRRHLQAGGSLFHRPRRQLPKARRLAAVRV